MFSGIYWNQPVCLSMCPSIYVQNSSFCQSAFRRIKSHLPIALVCSETFKHQSMSKSNLRTVFSGHK